MAFAKVAPIVGSLGLLLLGVPACSSASRICEPGATQRCVCAVGEGAQVCSADGTAWGTCSCGQLDGGPGDGGTADAGSDASHDASIDANVDGGCGMGATTATVSDVAHGTIAEGTRVRLEGVVVMSRVFLVQRSLSTGTCLWGVFVSAPGLTETAPYSGTLVASYGSMATVPDGGTTAYCPVLGEMPTGSALPENLQPGDVLDVVGEVASYLPTTCGATDTNVPAHRITSTCLVTRTGTTTPPAPALLAATDVARLANQFDAATHDAWGNVLVRLGASTASVPALPPSTCTVGTSVVSTSGTVHLDGSGLDVGDRLYYQGALRANPCYASPQFCASGTTFSWSRIVGFHYLDYCTWTLQPPDKCADFTPQSSDCVVSSCW